MDNVADLPEVEHSGDDSEILHPAPSPHKLKLLEVHSIEEVQRMIQLYSRIPAAKEAPEMFAMHLASPRSWFVELNSSGLVYLTEVLPHQSAIANFVFWDLSISKERRELVRSVFAAAVDRFDLHRLNAYIPITNRALEYAFKKMGFQTEGRMRLAFTYEGQKLDLLILGLLRSEIDWPSAEVE